MEKINKAIVKWFWIALISSILFVAGIPAIIFGAIFKKWILMSLGILCVAFNFYALPFFWIAYGEKFGYKRLIFAITQEHILLVDQLQVHLSKSYKDIQTMIQKSINKGYLTGYYFNGNSLQLNTRQNPNEKLLETRCLTCGANYSYKIKENPICPYCGKLN
ncbi:MAG: hypothetical protein IJW82_03210 [Clostridia bacterium]|nr:hypothetical protein [Clostridia bacterium]